MVKNLGLDGVGVKTVDGVYIKSEPSIYVVKVWGKRHWYPIQDKELCF